MTEGGLPLILRFNFPYPHKHKRQRRVFHLFLCWQIFVVIFSLFQSWQWCMELWKRLNATVTVTRHCLSPSNCLQCYNKSCDSGVQKKKNTSSNNSFVWADGNLYICSCSYHPYYLKFCENLTTSFHHSSETFYSAPYFCRTKKYIYKFLPSIIGTWYFTIRVSIFTAPHSHYGYYLIIEKLIAHLLIKRLC